jgi:hypothetical protein
MKHLSSEQIAGRLAGETDPQAEQHFEICKECSEDFTRLQQGLIEFKGAVHEWAKQPVEIRIPAHQPSWKWAAAAAAILGIALLPMYFEVRDAQQEAQSAQDALLLKRVQVRLSRRVPQPLEQLMNLMNEGKEGPQ